MKLKLFGFEIEFREETDDERSKREAKALRDRERRKRRRTGGSSAGGSE